MAYRRKRATKGSYRGRTKAPWRETRTVEGVIGRLCSPGFSEICENPSFPNYPDYMTDFTDPCATVSVYPVLWYQDWQPFDPATQETRWKERVVHSFTEVRVDLIANEGWINNAYTQWLGSVNSGGTGAGFYWGLGWRAALVIYDVDELITGAPSIFEPSWMENERYLPGTMREGIWWQPGLVGSQMNQAQKLRIKAPLKRRLETGEGLFLHFEVGCVRIGNSFASSFEEWWATYGPPILGLGTVRSSYVE